MLYTRSLVEDSRRTDCIYRTQKVQKLCQNVRLWFKASIFKQFTNFKASWKRLPNKHRWSRRHCRENEGIHYLSYPQTFWTIENFLLKNNVSSKKKKKNVSSSKNQKTGVWEKNMKSTHSYISKFIYKHTHTIVYKKNFQVTYS